MMILNELRYQSEIVSARDLDIPEEKKVNPKELAMAMQLIDTLTSHFKPKEYKDTFVEELEQIIKKKSRGQRVHSKTEESKPTKVHNIISLLEVSLTNQKKKSIKKLRKVA